MSDIVHCLGLQVAEAAGHERHEKAAVHVIEAAAERFIEVVHANIITINCSRRLSRLHLVLHTKLALSNEH